MKKILCVCYGNTCRSPMLQALLARELKSRGVEAVVESAGLLDEVDAPANEKAVICMKERGLDITEYRSRSIHNLNLSSYDRIYCVDKHLVEKLTALDAPTEKIEIVEEEKGGVKDPYGYGLDAYRACAEILKRVAVVLANKLA